MEKYIRDSQNNVLDVKAGKIKEGTKIILFAPNNGPNQQWTINHVEDGWCTIDLLGTGYCLDIKGNKVKNGTNVILWTKNGGHNQHWKVKYRGIAETDGRRHFSFHSRADENYVLDVKGGSPNELIIWNGHFEKNQLFKCNEAGLRL